MHSYKVKYKAIFTKNLCNNFIAILMKTGQRCLFSIKTVGRVNYRDRLGHRWVSEMMLNVQSESLFNISLYWSTRHYICIINLRVNTSIKPKNIKIIIELIMESSPVLKGKDKKVFNQTVLIPNIRSYLLKTNYDALYNNLSLNKNKLKLKI